MKELAHVAGKTEGWVSRLETGQINDEPSYSVIVKWSEMLGVSPDELAGVPLSEDTRHMAVIGKEVLELVERRSRPDLANIVRVDPTQVTSARVPVVNAVAASELMRHERQVEETIMVPAAALEGATTPVAFIIVGDCLRGQGLVTGDYLIVDAANTDPRDGEIVAARVNGEETAKCFYRVGDTIELLPDADGYEPIVVTERDELEIIGVYVGHIHIGKRGRR